MQIYPIPALADNYIWFIHHASGSAWVVDPGEAAPVLATLEAKNCQLRGILITHHHWDHTGGVETLVAQTSAQIYGPATLPFLTCQAVSPDSFLTLDAVLPPFQVLAIPGHTSDHLAYYAPGILFCGDTLFSAGCGRAFEGTLAQLYTSLQTLAALPDDTFVYCAHEYTETNLQFALSIEPEHPQLLQRLREVQTLRQQGLPSLPSLLAVEKMTNPFLRCHTPEMVAAVSRKAGTALTTPLAVFSWLRAAKDTYKAS